MKVSLDSVEQRHGKWHVAQTHTMDDGTTQRRVHIFPLDTLEWRAAEYGVDPKDTATLMDIVLAEGHMTEQDWATGSQLHTAPDIDTARKDHLARCAKVTQRHGMTASAGDPLKRIRDESPIHPEVIVVKAEHVAQERQQVQRAQRAQQSAKPAVVPSGAERAALLRQQLGVAGNTGH